MTQSPGVDLHDAVLATLKADARVGAIYGARIYDNPPEGVTWPYISLGAGDVTPEVDADGCLRMDVEALTIHLWHEEAGASWQAKNGCHAVRRALREAAPTLDLANHALAGLGIEQSRTFPLPDPAQHKGVVTVLARIEDRS